MQHRGRSVRCSAWPLAPTPCRSRGFAARSVSGRSACWPCGCERADRGGGDGRLRKVLRRRLRSHRRRWQNHRRCVPGSSSYSSFRRTSTSARASLASQSGGRFSFRGKFAAQATTRSTPMKITGAQALIKSLEMEGTEVLSGPPGGCILPAYDPLLDSSIRHILVRHEQGAGHMAEGYAHVTGRPGVAMVTSGPAATNMVTPLMDAYMDSIPMVAITGQAPTFAIGTDAFQECDTIGITRSVTKHNELIMTAQDVPMAVRQAFHIATTGRPGPTLIDVPKDVLQNTMEWHWPTDDEVTDSLPGYRPNTKGHPRMIREAAKLIMASERPVLYVGGGILKARAAEPLRELAELTDIHVVTTLMARGAFPDDHPLCLG